MPPQAASLLAALAAVAVVAVALLRGAPYAGGSDSYYATPTQCSGAKRDAPAAPAVATAALSHISYLQRRY